MSQPFLQDLVKQLVDHIAELEKEIEKLKNEAKGMVKIPDSWWPREYGKDSNWSQPLKFIYDPPAYLNPVYVGDQHPNPLPIMCKTEQEAVTQVL